MNCSVNGSCGKLTPLSPVLRLVFSQSLISLDLIEDFLEQACKAEDEKTSPYKGRFCIAVRHGLFYSRSAHCTQPVNL